MRDFGCASGFGDDSSHQKKCFCKKQQIERIKIRRMKIFHARN
jgi:hypothetical protein